MRGRIISIVVVLSLSAAQLIAEPAARDDGEFAVLIDGPGSYSRPISTKSELAQKFVSDPVVCPPGSQYHSCSRELFKTPRIEILANTAKHFAVLAAVS